MQESLRKRRRETFEMLVVKGYDYSRVCETLAGRYDVAESTIRTDINRMGDWIDKLAHFDDDRGIGRLLELQDNRQRLHQMATEARQADDLDQELRVRKTIDKSLMTEVELAQSLGQMAREPEEHQHDVDHSLSDAMWADMTDYYDGRETAAQTASADLAPDPESDGGDG